MSVTAPPLFPLLTLHSCEYYPCARLLPPDLSRKSLSEQQRHLRLLDAFALLLVPKEKSGGATVMYKRITSEVVFCYSKTRSSTSHEHEYLEQLRQLALTIPHITECTFQLLNHVIPMCRNKIMSRLRRPKNCIPSDARIIVRHGRNGVVHDTSNTYPIEQLTVLIIAAEALKCPEPFVREARIPPNLRDSR